MTVPGEAERTVRLNQADDVVVALADLVPGPLHLADGTALTLPAGVPRGHKLAIRAVGQGAAVHKYGQVIGYASVPIAPGDHVHSHNLEYRPVDAQVAVGSRRSPIAYVPEADRATFLGYRRANGRVGTRNYLGIVSSVNCSATVAKLVASRAEALVAQLPGVDGVVALTHTGGCGTAGRGHEGFDTLQRTLRGYAEHPNFAGLLVIGLGCEVNQVVSLAGDWEVADGVPVHLMTIQDLGGTRRTVEEAVRRIEEMLPVAAQARREPVPCSELVLAMECGGSDGYSGITANPALGAAADLVVQQGGTAIFGETPEIYGAEHLLLERAVSDEVGQRLVERIRWWQRHVEQDGSSLENNPSPGNKAGGLTTILEKSLGAIAKGGTTQLCDVVRYGERPSTRGLVYMDTPGYDPVNATGLVAGGATVLCFTTGRGSVFGSRPTPCLKLATNTELYQRMTEDMDINCGVIADGESTVPEVGQRIFDLILQTASGRRTLSEELGFGLEEFVPWQLGATL
ncbi:MAG TPA: altronate dehydratase family protein [Micromonosporaceae bacterium]|jgi:altronate hydrolase